jgi:DNA-directed RNA polymerase beta subunit
MATKPQQPSRASSKRRIRKIFGDIHEVVQMPNLIEVQRESYEQFLRSDPKIGYVSGLERRCAASSRSAISPAPASWTSSITNWKSPSTTSPNAVSAGSPMPRR